MTKHSRLTAWIATVALACAAPFVSADNTADAVPTAQQLQTQVEQNRKAVLAKIVEPVANRVIYFDKAGKPGDKPQKGGYFRRVLGKTANGGWVVEDFYQDSKTVQTDPAVLSEKDLRNFVDPKLDDGLHVGYYPNGKVLLTQEYRNGKEEGWASLYDNNGVLRVRDWYEQGKDTGHTQFFDAEGKKRGELNGSEERYWYANGQLAVVVPKGSEEPTQAWREDGAAVTDMEEMQSIRSKAVLVSMVSTDSVTSNIPNVDEWEEVIRNQSAEE